jgi:hypothetical protein
MKCKECSGEAMDEEIGLCDYCGCADLFDTWYQEKTENVLSSLDQHLPHNTTGEAR